MRSLFNFLYGAMLCCTFFAPIQAGALSFPAFYITCPSTSQWLLSSENGFIVTDLSKKKTSTISEHSLMLATYPDRLCINGHWLPPRLLSIKALKGAIEVNGREYCGDFMVSPQKKGFIISVVGASHKPYAEIILKMAEKMDAKNDSLDQESALAHIAHNDSSFNSKSKLQANVDKSVEENYQNQADLRANKTSFKVRVLLNESFGKNVWKLDCSNGFKLWNPKDSKKKMKVVKSELKVSMRNGKIYLNNKKLAHNHMYITPVGGQGHFQGKPYHGAFIVTEKNGRMLIINCVELEEYVSSVLGSESWPGWPLEVNKVFAVACRTYVIAMAMRAKKNNNLYHVRNTNLHQTYHGAHTNALLRKAVADTQGIFIAHNKIPIIAMFDSCCGGVIPAHIDGFDFIKAPYLAREYACMYCKECQLYSWQAEFSLPDFERNIGQKITARGKLKDIKIHKKDKAGLVQEVLFKNAKKAVSLTGKRLYSLIKEVKSYYFSVDKKKDKVVMKGRGYGHHLGLCQWGARQMVREGWDYQGILKFYYPGTDFMRVG